MEFQGILKSDIFFFVVTIAVAVMTIIVVIVGVYFIKILRDIRMAIKSVKFKYRFVEKIIRNIIRSR